jgi:hypothetical protein
MQADLARDLFTTTAPLRRETLAILEQFLQTGQLPGQLAPQAPLPIGAPGLPGGGLPGVLGGIPQPVAPITPYVTPGGIPVATGGQVTPSGQQLDLTVGEVYGQGPITVNVVEDPNVPYVTRPVTLQPSDRITVTRAGQSRGYTVPVSQAKLSDLAAWAGIPAEQLPAYTAAPSQAQTAYEQQVAQFPVLRQQAAQQYAQQVQQSAQQYAQQLAQYYQGQQAPGTGGVVQAGPPAAPGAAVLPTTSPVTLPVVSPAAVAAPYEQALNSAVEEYRRAVDTALLNKMAVPRREAVETQFSRARERILGSAERGGQMAGALDRLEVERALARAAVEGELAGAQFGVQQDIAQRQLGARGAAAEVRLSLDQQLVDQLREDALRNALTTLSMLGTQTDLANQLRTDLFSSALGAGLQTGPGLALQGLGRAGTGFSDAALVALGQQRLRTEQLGGIGRSLAGIDWGKLLGGTTVPTVASLNPGYTGFSAAAQAALGSPALQEFWLAGV